jgi:hypothetical protein
LGAIQHRNRWRSRPFRFSAPKTSELPPAAQKK